MVNDWSTFGDLAKEEGPQISVYGPFSCLILAERVGFEPTIPEDIPVFETGAFVRSAISPQSHSISQAAWRFKVTVASTPPGRGLKETLPAL